LADMATEIDAARSKGTAHGGADCSARGKPQR
jgi:hypothetical protein